MRIILLLFFLFYLDLPLSVQNVYTIKADSVKITGCDSAELILENHTQGVKGFLFNKGNGRAEFRNGSIKLTDSTYLIGGDTFKMLPAIKTALIPGPGIGITNATNDITISNNLSTGVAGGQTLTFGTASGDSGIITSTSNAGKGKIYLGSARNSFFDEGNNYLNIVSNQLGSAISLNSGLYLGNKTAATVGTTQYSPSFALEGQGWNTTSGASQSVIWQNYARIVAGASTPTIRWVMRRSINNTFSGPLLQLDESGVLYTSGDIAVLATTLRFSFNSGLFGTGSPGFLINTATNVLGSNDVLFQGVPGAGYSLFEAVSGLGVGLLTAGNRPIVFTPNSVIRATLNPVGKLGIGITSPTAYLHLRAGTDTAGAAPIKLTSSAGTVLATPEDGAIEYDGTDLYFTQSTTRYKLVKTLTGQIITDFSVSSINAFDYATIALTVTGAQTGDVVDVSSNFGAVISPAVIITAYITSANTVTLRAYNASNASVSMASQTYKVRVIK